MGRCARNRNRAFVASCFSPRARSGLRHRSVDARARTARDDDRRGHLECNARTGAAEDSSAVYTSRRICAPIRRHEFRRHHRIARLFSSGGFEITLGRNRTRPDSARGCRFRYVFVEPARVATVRPCAVGRQRLHSSAAPNRTTRERTRFAGRGQGVLFHIFAVRVPPLASLTSAYLGAA